MSQKIEDMMVSIRDHTMMVSVWGAGSDWCVPVVSLLHSTLTQSPPRPRPTPGPPLNHGLGHLATRHSNNEYYCRLMHFYHHLWQCAEQVSYCESYHKANQGNDAMNI